jgi:hypothetical protein
MSSFRRSMNSLHPHQTAPWKSQISQTNRRQRGKGVCLIPSDGVQGKKLERKMCAKNQIRTLESKTSHRLHNKTQHLIIVRILCDLKHQVPNTLSRIRLILRKQNPTEEMSTLEIHSIVKEQDVKTIGIPRMAVPFNKCGTLISLPTSTFTRDIPRTIPNLIPVDPVVAVLPASSTSSPRADQGSTKLAGQSISSNVSCIDFRDALT